MKNYKEKILSLIPNYYSKEEKEKIFLLLKNLAEIYLEVEK